ncbi:MAG TPA: EamA family transporter [Pyrinomonadaceae bacterium]|nr:EamA family transporter [Pyrinomonadaceae bacterium]
MTLQGIGKTESSRKLLILIAAFFAVYVFWGSTYLAIKYAMQTLPPFLMAGSRFLLAGGILFLWARLSKDYERPKWEHWRTSLIVGTLLLLGGNGGVVLAQHFIPSSLAALLVATEPLWIVVLSWLWLHQGRPSWKVVLGLLVGFVGVALLVTGRASNGIDSGGVGQWIGIIAVIIGAMSWAAGSIYGLRGSTPKSPILAAGMQMLMGSISLLVVGFIRGEWATFDPSAISSASVIGLIYLIIFGSLIGFTAYSWLLKNARPSMVATYAYVNPVIAVLLGWLIAGEAMTGQMLIAAGVIVGSVVLITSQSTPEPEPAIEKTHESIGQNDKAVAASA